MVSHASHGSARRLALTLVTTVTLLAGSAGMAVADWQAGGGPAEPNTRYDTADVMWPDGNAAARDRIYFNAFIVHGYWLAGEDVNRAGGTFTEGPYAVAAYLGYWRDCNGDGYIGARTVPAAYGVEPGAWGNGAYPREGADVDPGVCDGEPFVHDAFVDEFRWVGPRATPTDAELARGERFRCDPTEWLTIVEDCAKAWRDRFDVTDDGARVWADLWEEPRVSAPPQPTSLYSDSESFIAAVDAQAGVGHALEGTPGEAVWDAPRPVIGACEGDEFRFVEDSSDTCGLWPLWQARRLLDDDGYGGTGTDPLVTVFDTERDDDSSGNACDDVDVLGLAMADPEPGVTSDPLMDGSIAGTLMNVNAGTGYLAFHGECTPHPDAEPVVGADAGKTRVDVLLEYQPGSRYRTLDAAGAEHVPVEPPATQPGSGPTPTQPRWISRSGIVTNGPGLTHPLWIRAFADVTPEAFTNGGATPAALPAGEDDAHTYGDVECGGDFSDSPSNRERNAFGWQCSRNVWSQDAFARSEWGAFPVVGDTYDLRDTDCYDGTPARPLQPGSVPARPSCAGDGFATEALAAAKAVTAEATASAS